MITKNKLFILLLSTFFVFYFHALNVQGFFHDGYLYAALGKNFPWESWLIPSQSTTEFREFAHHPPLFFILEGLFFKIFGHNFWQARLFGLIWIFATFAVLFYFLSTRFNKVLAFFSSFLLLLIPSLMKKSRFPNMDQALLFSYTLCLLLYFEAWTKKSSRLWACSGCAWGLSLLIKGISGVLLLPLIFMHQVYVNRSLKFLLRKNIWIAFMCGLAVFSIWPLALLAIGRYDIFSEYLDFQLFNTAIGGRGQNDINHFIYPLHLIKNSPHITILFLWSLYLLFKNEITKFREFYLFNLICFLSYVIPLSFMKFKYSHYLIPIYPSFTIMASYPILLKVKFNEKGFLKVWSGVLVIAFIALFPMGTTNKVRRDKEIFETSYSFDKLKKIPSEWIIVDESYSYWAISGLSSFVFSANPHRLSSEQTISFITLNPVKSLVFTSDEPDVKLKKILDENFIILKKIPNKKMIVWSHRFNYL
ncbi:glycosyltransferase family 39 protein [Halobacteriovorax sp. HLS]|uniref:ArnT family glycosyltransferase n=1 Tax=Halobacteriovorax sp. HLS TaxID=2234000 RepID=UPI000FDA0BED|nr:glycosyltransferase family 39 protein [Halobacteriovorax sp. HLS]